MPPDALDARDYGELKGSGATIPWSPERSGGRRPAAADGEVRRRRGTRGGGREGRCPGGARAHQEHESADGKGRGGRTARRRCSDGGGQRGEDGDNGLEFGRPAPIPSAWRRSTTRRSWWWSPIHSGSSQSTARCASMGARVRPSGGEEGEREQGRRASGAREREAASGGGSLSTGGARQGGPRQHGGIGDMATVASLSPQGRCRFSEKPPATF